MTPALIEPTRPSGLPRVYASLPWCTARGSPRVAGTISVGGSVARMTAISCSGSRASDLRARARAVGERDVDLGRIGDHVEAGQDVAGGGDHDAAAQPVVGTCRSLRLGLLRLDQDERRPDRRVDLLGEGGRRGDRGERLGDRVVDVVLRQRRRARDERAPEQDRDEGHQRARRVRDDPSGTHPAADRAGRWFRSSSRGLVCHAKPRGRARR